MSGENKVAQIAGWVLITTALTLIGYCLWFTVHYELHDTRPVCYLTCGGN